MGRLLSSHRHLKSLSDLSTFYSPFRKAISLQSPVELGFFAGGLGRSGWRLFRQNVPIVETSA